MKEKIVFLRGLWSYPKAVDWIKNNLEDTTKLPVDLFDYHDILTDDLDNATYIKRVLEKYGDTYSKASEKIILMGHSHGGTLTVIMSEKFSLEKTVLINPAFRPWGVLRRIPIQFKSVLGNYGIGSGYHPHFVVKYDGEIEERVYYFKQNFSPLRDISRVYCTGTYALQTLKSLRKDLLLIQSLQDEFVSARVSLNSYENVLIPEYRTGIEGPSKDVMIVPNGEHAILEEEEEFPKVYKKIADFINR